MNHTNPFVGNSVVSLTLSLLCNIAIVLYRRCWILIFLQYYLFTDSIFHILCLASNEWHSF